MSISFSKKGKKSSGKNRAYVAAVALCCAAVGLVAWSSAINKNSTAPVDYDAEDFPAQEYTDSNIEWYDGESEVVYQEPEPPAQSAAVNAESPEEITDIPLSATPTEPAAISVSATVTPTDTQAVIAEPVSYQLPTSGGIITHFSGNELVFSKTMCDWRVHQGIDIECAAGTSISSCGVGTVFDVIEDPMFGTTVIVDVAGGKTIYYCGLESSSVTVKKGQNVNAGDILGTVGTVPCEAADGTHIHLAVLKDGSYVDPLTALGLN